MLICFDMLVLIYYNYVMFMNTYWSLMYCNCLIILYSMIANIGLKTILFSVLIGKIFYYHLVKRMG